MVCSLPFWDTTTAHPTHWPTRTRRWGRGWGVGQRQAVPPHLQCLVLLGPRGLKMHLSMTAVENKKGILIRPTLWWRDKKDLEGG